LFRSIDEPYTQPVVKDGCIWFHTILHYMEMFSTENDPLEMNKRRRLWPVVFGIKATYEAVVEYLKTQVKTYPWLRLSYPAADEIKISIAYTQASEVILVLKHEPGRTTVVSVESVGVCKYTFDADGKPLVSWTCCGRDDKKFTPVFDNEDEGSGMCEVCEAEYKERQAEYDELPKTPRRRKGDPVDDYVE
jgi:hypothetical protein